MKKNVVESSNLAHIRIVRTMLHDIRSPLTSIGGFAQLLLRDDSISGESREYLEIITNEAVKMNEILTKFLFDMENASCGDE